MPRRSMSYAPRQMEYAHNGRPVLGQRDKDQGLGGFPGPIQLSTQVAKKYFPQAYRKVTMMMPAERPPEEKGLKWLSDNLKDVVVGRNSEFNTEELSDEQLEELGGIE